MKIRTSFGTEQVQFWDILSPLEAEDRRHSSKRRSGAAKKPRSGISLKRARKILEPVGSLDSKEIEVYRIRRKKSRNRDDDLGFLTALVSPDGKVTVTEIHIDPDMVERVKALFSKTSLKVEDLGWC